MAITIRKAGEPLGVDALVVVIYGQPGVGKTTLACSADAPLLLDFDGGAYRAALTADTVSISTWADVDGLSEDDLNPYETIVVDTAGRCLDVLAADIIRRNPRAERGGSGALTMQGYGELKGRFAAWMKKLRGFGKDVVLVAHGAEEKSGEETAYRLDMAGSSKNLVYQEASIMGHLAVKGKDLVWTLNPTEAAFGKNPGQLAPVVLPPVVDAGAVLADAIATTKSVINRPRRSLSDLRDQMAETIKSGEKTANEWLTELREAEAPKDERRVLGQVAKEAGCAWNHDRREFTGGPPKKQPKRNGAPKRKVAVRRAPAAADSAEVPF